MSDSLAPSPLEGEGWGEGGARGVWWRDFAMSRRLRERSIGEKALFVAERFPLTLTLPLQGGGDQITWT
jgi:hypothetical protein